MAQAEVIREFLVSLGFKTDEKSLKKFTDGIEGATKGVAKLVTVIAGAALTVGAGVAAFAANMEALYFASMKTGASATNLKAFEKSAQNFGAASGEALASVQSLAKWMRETPEAEGFLQGLGIQTRDAKGNLKDTTDMMVEMGKVLAKMDYPEARQYGNMFGIGDDMLRAMMNGDFSRELEKQRALLKDAGYEEATKKAHEFGIRMRELQTKIEAVGVSIGLGALDWIDKYNPAIQATITLVGKLVSALGDAAKFLMDFGFRTTAGAMMLGRLATGDIKGAREAARAMVDGMDKASGGQPPSASTDNGRTSSGKIGGLGAMDPMQIFMGMGWSKEQAAGIVANLQRESRMNPHAVGDSGQAYGIAQWHPDRQANFAKWAGKDIRQSTVEEQMQFVNYELTQGAERRAGMLLRASQSAEMAGHIMSKYYERPKDVAGEAAKRGESAVSIAQTTTINVNGGDAAATGRAVAGEQSQVNQTLARNMKTALN